MKKTIVLGVVAAIFTIVLFIVGKMETNLTVDSSWYEMFELGLLASGIVAYAISFMFHKCSRQQVAVVAIAGLVMTAFAGFFTMLLFVLFTAVNCFINNARTFKEIDSFLEED